MDWEPIDQVEISVGSAVQIDDPLRYGVLRWIGAFPNSEEMRAGIELVSVYV